MENPFEIINQKFDKIISLLEHSFPQHNSKTAGHQVQPLDIKAAAEFLRISKQTIYHLTMKKEIPHYKVGKRLYFSPDELSTWIARGKVKTQSELIEDANQYLTSRKFKSK